MADEARVAVVEEVARVILDRNLSDAVARWANADFGGVPVQLKPEELEEALELAEQWRSFEE